MKEFKALRDYITEVPDKKKIVRFDTSQKNPCYYYSGQSQGCYATEQTKRVIDVISLKLFQKFPDRKDRRLSVADGCSSTGATIEGHAAHGGGYRIDFNYFTFGKNTTQYVPSWMNNKYRQEKGMYGYKVDQELLWKYMRDGKGILPIFDWERNFTFYVWVVDVLPRAEILVSTGIYRELRSRTAGTKFSVDWKKIENNLRDTGNIQWNHHTHCHIDFGNINSGGFDIDWDKEREWLKCVI